MKETCCTWCAAGSIGCAEWAGARLREVLAAAGFPVHAPLSRGAAPLALEGADWHPGIKQYYRTSIDIARRASAMLPAPSSMCD